MIAVGKRKLILKTGRAIFVIEVEKDSIKISIKGKDVSKVLREIVQLIKELKDSKGALLLRCYKTSSSTIRMCIDHYEKNAKDRIEILNFKGRCKEYKNDIILFQELVNLIFTLLLKDIVVLINRRPIKTMSDIENSIKLCVEDYGSVNDINDRKSILDYFY